MHGGMNGIEMTKILKKKASDKEKYFPIMIIGLSGNEGT